MWIAGLGWLSADRTYEAIHCFRDGLIADSSHAGSLFKLNDIIEQLQKGSSYSSCSMARYYEGVAWRALECEDQALESFHAAVALDPALDGALQALAEIERGEDWAVSVRHSVMGSDERSSFDPVDLSSSPDRGAGIVCLADALPEEKAEQVCRRSSCCERRQHV